MLKAGYKGKPKEDTRAPRNDGDTNLRLERENRVKRKTSTEAMEANATLPRCRKNLRRLLKLVGIFFPFKPDPGFEVREDLVYVLSESILVSPGIVLRAPDF